MGLVYVDIELVNAEDLTLAKSYNWRRRSETHDCKYAC